MANMLLVEGGSKARNLGFSLLEILMAMAILSFGILGTGALLAGIINGNRISKDLTTATVLAQDKIENLRGMGFSGLPSTDSSVTEDYGSISYSNGGETIDYPAFKRVTSVSVEDPVAGMKTITVQVYGRSGLNPTTLIAVMAE